MEPDEVDNLEGGFKYICHYNHKMRVFGIFSSFLGDLAVDLVIVSWDGQYNGIQTIQELLIPHLANGCV